MQGLHLLYKEGMILFIIIYIIGYISVASYMIADSTSTGTVGIKDMLLILIMSVLSWILVVILVVVTIIIRHRPKPEYKEPSCKNVIKGFYDEKNI